MAELERVYIIPLRKECRKAPKYERASKAIRAVREFLQKHMKCKNVKLGNYLNMKILERGKQKPPHHVEVKAIKEKIKKKDKEIEIVRAELVGAPVEKEKPIKEEKKKKTKEKEISKIVREKEKEKEKVERAPKEEKRRVSEQAREEVAQGIQRSIIGRTQKTRHLKSK